MVQGLGNSYLKKIVPALLLFEVDVVVNLCSSHKHSQACQISHGPPWT